MAFEGDEQREELSNKSEIQRLLKDLNDAIIGFENYKKYFDKVKSSDGVIISQIENLTREYREYRERYKAVVDKDSFKQMKEDGWIPVEALENAKMMNKIVLEAMSWKTLQEEMYSIIFTKVFQVLDDARALDIKRDALKEMREMETQRQEMFIKVMENMGNVFKEAVTNKLQAYDEKIFNFMLMNDEEHRKDRRDIFTAVKEIASKSSLSEQDKKDILSRFGVEFRGVADRIYPQKEDDEQGWKKSKQSEEGEDDDEPEGFGNLLDEDDEDGNADIDAKYAKKKKGGKK